MKAIKTTCIICGVDFTSRIDEEKEKKLPSLFSKIWTTFCSQLDISNSSDYDDILNYFRNVSEMPFCEGACRNDVAQLFILHGKLESIQHRIGTVKRKISTTILNSIKTDSVDTECSTSILLNTDPDSNDDLLVLFYNKEIDQRIQLLRQQTAQHFQPKPVVENNGMIKQEENTLSSDANAGRHTFIKTTPVQGPSSSSSSLPLSNQHRVNNSKYSAISFPMKIQTARKTKARQETRSNFCNSATNLDENKWKEHDDDDEKVGVIFESICVPEIQDEIKQENEQDIEMEMEMEMDFTDPSKPFKCVYLNCPRRFSNRPALARHRLIHKKKRPFPCHVQGCPRKFKRRDHVLAHIRRVHLPKSPSSEREPTPFSNTNPENATARVDEVDVKPDYLNFTADLILPHVQPAINQIPLRLAATTATAKTSIHHSIIMRNGAPIIVPSTSANSINSTVGTGAQDFKQCPHCEKVLKSQKTLQRHLKTHQVPPFVCQYCRKSFAAKYYLNQHRRTHSSQYNLQCDEDLIMNQGD